MSEYQYYEFLALDKPLDERALGNLRRLSSRATITATSFVNEYNYGDFRGNPRLLMEKYFDVFVYVASWGVNQLMVRLPRDAVDIKTLACYCIEDALSVQAKGGHVILDFYSAEEGGDWVQGEGWLSTLAPLRNDILAGDLRSLYLAWLAAQYSDDLAETTLEPTVPPGLGDLSGALRGLAEFLRVDTAMLEAAASHSTELCSASRKTRARPHGDRTVAELLAEARQITHREEQEAAARTERQRKRRERKEALERTKRLDELAPRKAAAWRDIEKLIAFKQSAKYAEAISLIQDLQALAVREEKQKNFEKRLHTLRLRHGRKRTFMRSLNEAGL